MSSVLSEFVEGRLRAVHGSTLAACLHEMSVTGMSRAEASCAAASL
jgi:hypothetical protein